MKARTAFVAAFVTLLVAGACGQGERQASSHTKSTVALRSSASEAISTAQYEAYVVPGSGPVDGTTYLHHIGSAPASTAADRLLGSFSDALVISDGGKQYRIFTASITATATLFTPSGTQEWSGTSPGARVADEVGATTWLQEGKAAESITGSDTANADASAARPLPALEPTSRSQSQLAKRITGDVPGNVTAWVTAPNGDVLDLTSTGSAAGIQDVTTGRTAAVGQYEVAEGAAAGVDGVIYTAAWNLDQPTDTIHVMGIDPGSLQIVSDSDLGIPADGTRPVSLLGDGARGVLVLIPAGRAGQPISMTIFAVASGGTVSNGPSVPNNVGLGGALDGPDTLLLYGGPAHNDVSKVDLPTGSVSADASLDTPPGTYVLSVG